MAGLSSITDRTLAYQAACKRSLDSAAPELPRSARRGVGGAPPRSPGTGLAMRSGTGTPGTLKSPERPLRKLSDLSEQHALKTGLRKLVQALVANRDVQATELPTCANGAPKVLQSSSLLQRLINNEVEFKSCMESDVSAAQSDLRHLNPEQLLSIRGRTLDFATESQSHSARNGFLETVDKHLFNKLARRCLRGSIAPMRPEVVHALGLRLALILGATELIEAGWGSKRAAGCRGELPPVPPCWAFKLNGEEWPDGCQAAVFNATELWVEPLPGPNPDFAAATSGSPLAVLCDRTNGVGKHRMLHWDIAVLDPCSEDVLAELERDPSERGTRRRLVDELTASLSSRSPMVGTI